MSARAREVRAATRVERKAADLPCYVAVPARRVAALGARQTTTVDVELNGVAIGRRSLKPWPPDRWFIDLTERMCRRADVAEGDRVDLVLRRASEALPRELAALLRRDAKARRAWEALSASRQRMLREHVREAKTSATRSRRAERSLRPR